jgi:hypothetical protein
MSAEKCCLISRDKIARRVRELAEEIGRDYAGRDLVMVGVLKGAFIFLADLVRALPFPVIVDFVRVKSYGLYRLCGGKRLPGGLRLGLRRTEPHSAGDFYPGKGLRPKRNHAAFRLSLSWIWRGRGGFKTRPYISS